MRGEIPYSGEDSAGHARQVATCAPFRAKVSLQKLSTRTLGGLHAEMSRLHFPLAFVEDYTQR